jgi:Zn-dependent peptidase ImmA (M78 family)
MAEGKNPFMPFVDDFETEAEAFLKKYRCEEAIRIPMPIPIWDIATRLMSLDVIQTENLSPDESVQGAIAFTEGIIEIYDWSAQEYIGYEAKKGMVFLDADILNEGRLNNTLAHECFHWYKHRHYFIYRQNHMEGSEFAFRCQQGASKSVRDNNKWTDEEKMEWQARTIAPKILMPRVAATIKIEQLYSEELKKMPSDGRFGVTKTVIDRLADFYCVSRQSASIRMQELGYPEAGEFYQYDDSREVCNQRQTREITKAKMHQQSISLADAFQLYYTNEYLKVIIDTGAFCYVDGYFVIKDEKYIANIGETSCSLTEYARQHLSECTLDFSNKLVSSSSGNEKLMHVMFRTDVQYKKVSNFDATIQNAEMYNKGKEFERYQAQFEADFAISTVTNKTATQKLREVLELRHWNAAVFTERTHLDKMFFSRLKKDNYRITLEPIIAICAGLDLPIQSATDILAAAGYTLKPTDKKHQAYSFILSSMKGESIDTRNAFLVSIGVDPLSSQSREE